MISKRAVVAFVVTQMIAACAFAQEATEFGRASGGELNLFTKQRQKLSGSFGFSLGNSKGFGATAGGTIIPDRMWFFATTERMNTPLTAANAGVNARFDDRRELAANVAAIGRSAFDKSAASLIGPTSANFLSLRYTGVISSSSYFKINISQSSTKQPLTLLP